MSLRVVIIGNGIAGTTAARFVRKAGPHTITMVSDETDHPYARTSLMYVFMGHVRYEDIKLYEDRFWAKNRIERVRARVVHIDQEAHRVTLHTGRALDYDRLVIATGSSPLAGRWPGEQLPGVYNFYGIADVEKLDAHVGDGKKVRRATVIGGGLSGVELSEMLHTRGVQVTYLVRGARYMGSTLPPEESALVEKEIRRHGIELRLNSEAALFEGADRVAQVVTTGGERIEADLVAVAIGVRPNLVALEGSGIETRRGVLVDAHLRTSAPDVFAAGDCIEWRQADTGHAPVEQLWYTGRLQGYYAARNLLGDSAPYEKGMYYNSAKFYTLEWQQYGFVPPVPGDDAASVVWQDGQRLIRLVYRPSGQALVGVNVMGVRYRAEVCGAWIKAGTPLPEVVAQLARANFDPEFHHRPERQLQQAFEAQRARLSTVPTLTLA